VGGDRPPASNVYYSLSPKSDIELSREVSSSITVVILCTIDKDGSNDILFPGPTIPVYAYPSMAGQFDSQSCLVRYGYTRTK
jgi:hypothetical protein